MALASSSPPRGRAAALLLVLALLAALAGLAQGGLFNPFKPTSSKPAAGAEDGEDAQQSGQQSGQHETGAINEYDYIVIGAGGCGAVIASRLAEQGQSVLVLETGEDEHLNPLTRWGYFFPSGAYSHLYRNYFTEPESRVNNRRLYHQAAKALGGGTAVNAMVWTWGDRADWELIDLEGWSFQDVYPYFLKSENYTGQGSDDRRALARGHEGPVTLTSFPPNEATKAAVATAADVFGIPAEVDNNGGIHESASVVQRNFKGRTIDTGMRMGTFMAYLRPAMAKQPKEILEVATRATVLKILIGEEEDDAEEEAAGTDGPPAQAGATPRRLRALGVRYLKDGVCHEAMAREEVVLSAGAYNSPKLLMLSGVGDCRHLQQVGIPCVLNSPGVGRNLVDHINPGSLLFTGPPRDDYDANIVAAYTRTGVVADLTPDVELGFIMGPPAEDPAVWGHVPSLYVFYSLWLLHDGVGSVRLKSKDPLEDPVIVSGYLRTPDDEKRLVRIFRMLLDWAAEFASVSGLTLEQQPAGGNAINVNRKSTDEEIVRAAKTVLSTHWHAAQSCRMGDPRKDREAVVDTRFNLLGVDGLRVVDASSQPVLTNGHPMAALVMMAERASEFLAQDREGEDRRRRRHRRRKQLRR